MTTISFIILTSAPLFCEDLAAMLSESFQGFPRFPNSSNLFVILFGKLQSVPKMLG